jgi:PadR family transcriptional regulator, regulatory protein PadR
MAIDKDWIRSVAEPIVLQVVSEKPAYGYEIIKIINARTNGALVWKEGTLYPCLHRMEGSGLIKSEWRTGETGRSRKYYTITRKGTARLKSKIGEWAVFSQAVSASLMVPRGA